jgi:transposase
MPGQRLPMRNIRDVLRLKAGGMSKRQIAASLSVSSTSVLNCLRRSQAVGLGWPLPEDMTDEALESRLYPPPVVVPEDRRPQPDWAAVHRELKRPGVTLQLIWQEYRAQHPEGYGYSRFCELYLRWKGRLSPARSCSSTTPAPRSTSSTG